MKTRNKCFSFVIYGLPLALLLSLLLPYSLNVYASGAPTLKFGSFKDNNQFSDPDEQLAGEAVGDFQLGNALFRKL